MKYGVCEIFQVKKILQKFGTGENFLTEVVKNSIRNLVSEKIKFSSWIIKQLLNKHFFKTLLF